MKSYLAAYDLHGPIVVPITGSIIGLITGPNVYYKKGGFIIKTCKKDLFMKSVRLLSKIKSPARNAPTCST